MRILLFLAMGVAAATTVSIAFFNLHDRREETDQSSIASSPPGVVSVKNQMVSALKTTDVHRIRGQVCERGLNVATYRQVDSAPSAEIPKRQELTAFNEGIWQMSDSWGKHEIGNPIDWNAEEGMNRSEKFAFHAWRPLKDVLVRYSYKNEPELLDWAMQQSISYANGRFFANNDYRIDKSGDYTWYDMAAGLRARFLAVLLHGASCSASVSDPDFELLFRFAVDHVNYLANERYYVSHNNHGAYQSFGLIFLCKHVPEIPSCAAGAQIGEARLQEYFDERTSDGILLEHSPSYQILVIQMLGQFLESPEVFSVVFLEQHKKLLRDMLATTDMFLTSNNTFVQFGDTGSPVKNFGATERACLTLDMESNCISADAASSVKSFNDDRVVFFAPNAGYAGFREPVDFITKDGAYLMMSAAFHSRVHKHNDDLSFVWSDLGHDILTDAGQYGYSRLANRELSAREKELGYYYSDPKRMYVESIHAHNTVEIDGASPPRAKVPFFGAGDLNVRQEGEVIIIRGTVPRYDTEKGSHTRWLVSKPGSFLLVKDQIEDRSERSKQFSVWHHFKPTFDDGSIIDGQVLIQQEDLSISIWPAEGEPNNVRLVRGQIEPRLQGWRSESSRQLTPAFALGFQFEGPDLNSALIFSLNGAVVDAKATEISGETHYTITSAVGQTWEFSLF